MVANVTQQKCSNNRHETILEFVKCYEQISYGGYILIT